MRIRTLLTMLLLPTAAAAQVATLPAPPRAPAPPLPLATTLGDLTTSLDLDRSRLAATLDRFAESEARYAVMAERFAADGERFALEAERLAFDATRFVGFGGATLPPPAWLQGDPADSLYRLARETLNRGDYRRAATLFGDIAKRFPTSPYTRDVPYWQAFSLYRVGGTPELQEALGILERWRSQPVTESVKAPAPPVSSPTALVPRDSRASVAVASLNTTIVTWPGIGSRPDGDALAARIAGVLSSRGLGNDAAVRRALTARGADACDPEEQAVRSEALNALLRSDPEAARGVATRALARKDECSVPLRRTALFALGRNRDAAATSVMIGVARNDPSATMRRQAIDWLGAVPGDDAVSALEELTRDPDASVQRAAARALVMNPSPRARAAVRAVIERNDAQESLRTMLLDAFTIERASAEDAAWLRSVYGKTTSTRVQARIAAAVARVGGEANVQWLTAIARNEDESLDSRLAAMRSIVETADVATLVRLYDAASHQRIRSTVLDALGRRKEPAALDKLIEIARSATDPSDRRLAIQHLSSSKDPRATKLLLELVDR